jgi:hypothetical protein
MHPIWTNRQLFGVVNSPENSEVQVVLEYCLFDKLCWTSTERSCSHDSELITVEFVNGPEHEGTLGHGLPTIQPLGF